MLHLLITHIPSTLLHLLTGMIVMDLFFNNWQVPYKRQGTVLLLGSFIVLTPDIPKLLGVISLHSLLYMPFLAALLALFVQKILKESYIKVWMGIMTVLLIGSIGIDLTGDGVHLLYPLTEKNLSISINKDYWLPDVLTLYVAIRFTLVLKSYIDKQNTRQSI